MEPPNNCKVYLFAAYVDMANAQLAIDSLHNTDFMGNPIILSLAELVEPLSKDRKRKEEPPQPAVPARNQYGGVRLGVGQGVSGLVVAQQLRIHVGLTGCRDLTR